MSNNWVRGGWWLGVGNRRVAISWSWESQHPWSDRRVPHVSDFWRLEDITLPTMTPHVSSMSLSWPQQQTQDRVIQMLDWGQSDHIRSCSPIGPYGRPSSPVVELDPRRASRSRPQAWRHPYRESVFFYNWPWREAEIQHFLDTRSIPSSNISEVYPSTRDWMNIYESLRWSVEERVLMMLSSFQIGLWGVRNAGTGDIQESEMAVYIGAREHEKYPGTNAIRLSVNKKLRYLNDIEMKPVITHPNHWLLLVLPQDVH